MSRPEPLRPDLPDDGAPSPEVLDELLRVFAADEQDPARLDEVDFASPEVADLLTPTPHDDEAADPEPATDEDDAGLDGDVAAVADDEVAGDDHDGAVDDDVPVDDVQLDDDAVDEDAVDEDAVDEDEGDGEPAAVEEVRVAGDPFLGGSPVEADEPATEDGPRTISIVDEGLPDSVYIGGNLEPTDTSRSTVLIEDRGGGVMISTEEAASAARIEPRLRDRRDAVKRARIRKRVKWGILASVLVLLVVAALAVLGSGLFAIEEVRVEGAARTDPEALAQVIADLEGTPVLRADTGAAERELEQLPWVEDARVTTDFPDAATIELRERTPSAAFQGDDGAWRLVDDQGRVLEVGDEQPTGYLAVRGSGFPDVEPGQYGPPGLAGAATLARSLTPTVLARTAEITVTPDGSDLRLHFTDGAEVRFGAADELVQKLVRLETKLHDLGGDRVNYIDVSTNEVGQG